MLCTARTNSCLGAAGHRGVHVGEPRRGVFQEELDHFFEKPVVAFRLEALEGFEAVAVENRGIGRQAVGQFRSWQDR